MLNDKTLCRYAFKMTSLWKLPQGGYEIHYLFT